MLDIQYFLVNFTVWDDFFLKRTPFSKFSIKNNIVALSLAIFVDWLISGNSHYQAHI